MAETKQVVIVGGGLAGLAAAAALAESGFRVALLESRMRLGGRASSFQDSQSEQLVDACQHVSMGCCTNLAHFCKTIGINGFLEPQRQLHFMTPDRRMSTFASDPLPAPLHLARSLWRAHYLTPADKFRIGWGMLQLRRARPEDDSPLLPWLRKNRQSDNAIRRFWNVVLVSALNETVENLGLKYARKVFVDAFLSHRRGFDVSIPTVPLARLYGVEMQSWFAANGVEIRLNAGVRELQISNGRVVALLLRDGSTLPVNICVAAVPFDRLLALLPAQEIAHRAEFTKLKQLDVSPIASVHLWHDRPVLDLPHVVLVDCIGQWIFNRGRLADGSYYMQLVISAAEEMAKTGSERILELVLAELRRLFPAMAAATLLKSRVVTEHRATFRPRPGVDALRPGQRTSVGNLYLAGDWTRTGWPATMEGAVRSGYRAAEAIAADMGNPRQVLQPDLNGKRDTIAI